MDYTKFKYRKVDRYTGEISAHKVLESRSKGKGGGYVTVCACAPRISGGRLEVETSMEYKPGTFVDLRLGYTAYNGTICSYQCTFLGETPEQFAPKNGDWER